MTFYSSKVSKKVYKFQKFWAYVYQDYDQIILVPFFLYFNCSNSFSFNRSKLFFSACRRWIPSFVKDVCVLFCIVMFSIRWQLAHSSNGTTIPTIFPGVRMLVHQLPISSGASYDRSLEIWTTGTTCSHTMTLRTSTPTLQTLSRKIPNWRKTHEGHIWKGV